MKPIRVAKLSYGEIETTGWFSSYTQFIFKLCAVTSQANAVSAINYRVRGNFALAYNLSTHLSTVPITDLSAYVTAHT